MSSKYKDLREPAVAGYFYPADADQLTKQIEQCFISKIGPGSLPTYPAKGVRNLIGLVSPHAGYIYSGPVAAHGYKYIASDGLPESFVILGPNHTGVGSGVSIFPQGMWRTPLGVVEIDYELANAILKSSGIIDIDTTAHRYEHSIEVQLPFLQYIYEKANKSFKFVPIVLMMQDINTALDIGKAIYEGISEVGRDTVIIASTDFTHYEPHHVAQEKDRYAIEQILNLNPSGLIREVYERDISMCGFGPVAAMLEAARLLGAKKTHLLKYATSGDVTGDKSSVVAYASIIITK